MHSLSFNSWISTVPDSLGNIDPWHLLPLFVLCISAYLLSPHLRRKIPGTSPSVDEGRASQIASNKNRQYGDWTPVNFTYPDITPNTQELVDIKPIPYRPFKAGIYHVTMGIRSMPWDEWIELDNEYVAYQRIRSHRLRTRGSKALALLPARPGVVGSAYEAAIELVHELAEYLIRRYPTTFRATRHSPQYITKINSNSQRKGRVHYGWAGAPPVKDITVLPLGMTYRVPLSVDEDQPASVEHQSGSGTGVFASNDSSGSDNDTLRKRTAERALEVAALLIQDDIALMVEGEDGRYYFQGGAICVAGFWRMEDKLGLPLEEIHLSGNVPQCE